MSWADSHTACSYWDILSSAKTGSQNKPLSFCGDLFAVCVIAAEHYHSIHPKWTLSCISCSNCIPPKSLGGGAKEELSLGLGLQPKALACHLFWQPELSLGIHLKRILQLKNVWEVLLHSIKPRKPKAMFSERRSDYIHEPVEQLLQLFLDFRHNSFYHLSYAGHFCLCLGCLVQQISLLKFSEAPSLSDKAVTPAWKNSSQESWMTFLGNIPEWHIGN